MCIAMFLLFVDQIIIAAMSVLIFPLIEKCIELLCYLLFKIWRVFVVLCRAPFVLGKYLYKRRKSSLELEQQLYKQVYAARLKIHHGGNVLEGKLELAMLSIYYGHKRIAEILREVETWFFDV